MHMEITKIELLEMLKRQVHGFFLLRESEYSILEECLDLALVEAEKCYSSIKNKYFNKDGSTYFNPFHSGQYATFLYVLSRSIFTKYPNHRTLADRIYYINKALNGVDLFYEIKLPTVFYSDHPVGTVMGRGQYGNFFTFAQNCTVGNNRGIFPQIGNNVVMAAGATLLGNCKIGDNVIIGAHTYLKDTDIPSCSIVFGVYPNITIKERDAEYFRNALISYKGFNGWD